MHAGEVRPALLHLCAPVLNGRRASEKDGCVAATGTGNGRKRRWKPLVRGPIVRARRFFRKELFVLDSSRRKGCSADRRRELFTVASTEEAREGERESVRGPVAGEGIRGSNRSKENVGRLAFQVLRTGTNCVSSAAVRVHVHGYLGPLLSLLPLDSLRLAVPCVAVRFVFRFEFRITAFSASRRLPSPPNLRANWRLL